MSNGNVVRVLKKTVLLGLTTSLLASCGGSGGASNSNNLNTDTVNGTPPDSTPTPVPPTVERSGDFPWSKHEVAVTSPDCSAADAFIVKTVTDLDQLNNPNYRVFCIQPGDYRGYVSPIGSGGYDKGKLQLTLSGTATNKRVLALYNPAKPTDRRVAVQLPMAEQAIFYGIELDGASHWVVDRLSFEMDGLRLNYVKNGASDNVFNGNVFNKPNGRALHIKDKSHRNVIQNNLWRTTPTGVGDRIGVLIGDNVTNTLVEGTKIINNECYDTTDCVQLYLPDPSAEDSTNQTNSSYANFPDTLIENNDFYNTRSTLKNCADGTTCSWYENAIDIKSGSTDATRPVVVKNNRMWLHYPTHPDSKSSSVGEAIVVHQRSMNVHVLSNTLHDGRRGIVVYPTLESTYKGMRVEDNIIQDYSETALITGLSIDMQVKNNTIQNGGKWVFGGSNQKFVSCNVVMDSEKAANAGALVIDKNAFYNTPETRGSNGLFRNTTAEANMADLCYDRKMWSGVERHCLKDMKTTSESPHVSHCN